MAQGVNKTKTPARPSHEAIEQKPGNVMDAGKTKEEKVDRAAMKGAKRASNRIKSHGDSSLGDAIFTK